MHKERKVYLLDTPRIEDPAARFENLAALELWRAVSCWNALGEGDFSDEQPSKALAAMQRQLGVPAVQLVRDAAAYRTFTSDSLPLLVAPAWAGLPG